jgi:hypothetical protein
LTVKTADGAPVLVAVTFNVWDLFVHVAVGIVTVSVCGFTVTVTVAGPDEAVPSKAE